MSHHFSLVCGVLCLGDLKKIKVLFMLICVILKSHRVWNNAPYIISVPSTMILPTTVVIYHGWNCFSHICAAFKSHMEWRNEHYVNWPTIAILTTTMVIYHRLNCFGHIFLCGFQITHQVKQCQHTNYPHTYLPWLELLCSNLYVHLSNDTWSKAIHIMSAHELPQWLSTMA